MPRCVGDDFNLGWTVAGEWLNYTVSIADAGLYMLDLRVASEGDGSSLHIDLDGAPLTGSVAVSPTGGWQTWTTVTVGPLDFPAGEHVLTLHIDDGDFNLDWMRFE